MLAPAFASDADGSYYVGGGAGAVTCPEFSDVMRAARAGGIGSVQYVHQTEGYTMYVLGYQTGYNQQAPATYNIFANISPDQALAWIDNYCQAHPLGTFSEGLRALAASRVGRLGVGRRNP
jgi:hypothetical protein